MSVVDQLKNGLGIAGDNPTKPATTIGMPNVFAQIASDFVSGKNASLGGVAKNLISSGGNVPEATAKYVAEKPQGILELAKSFGQGVLRGFASTGLTLLGGQAKRSVLEIDPTAPKAEQEIHRFLLGDEPVKDIATRVAEAEIRLPKGEELPFGIKAPSGLALPGIIGLAALDFTGLGGEAKAAKSIAALTDTVEIGKILKGMGVAEDLIESTAKLLAKTTKVDEVSKVLSRLDEFQTAAKGVAQEAKGSLLSTLRKDLGLTTDAKERGFITSAKEALPEAEKIAGQYIPRSTDDLSIKARNQIIDDINIAENLAKTGSDEKAVATASELLKYYGQEAEKATDVGIKNALYDKAAEIANAIAPKLTEQGRSVQAASILGRMTPEGQLRFAASQISKYNETVPIAKRIPELTGEQGRYIIEEKKAIDAMADGVEKSIRLQSLQNYITDLLPTPLFKKIIAVWKAGLLTGLKTSGLNIFSNLSHSITETAKDIPAAMVDQITSLFTGTRTKTFNVEGLSQGAKEGLEKGLRYLKTGFDDRDIGTKLDYTRVNFGQGKIAKVLQTYTDAVFRVLGTEDQPFYYAAKLRSLYEQAKVAAINKGLKGAEAQGFIDDLIENPTEQMLKYASTDAETAVFQNKTALGNAAKAIQRIPVGEVIVPFGRTPSAVATQIINYSPLGIAKTIFENVGKGKFDQRMFATGIGRGLTGTGILALGALMMKKGIMTLARPTGEAEQKLWELEGKQPNSIKINGKWRQIQVLGPAGNVLLIGGAFQDEFAKSGSPSEAISNALANATRSFSQQTFLTGVSNFIDAISDPARSAQSVIGSTLASVVPTFVSDVARATDSKERRANEIFEKLQARIPGLRETLEPQVDVLGRERESVGNPLEIMADPTRPSPSSSNPVVLELRRLWDAGFKVSPTLLGDKKGYKSLTPEENTELWKKAGTLLNDKLSRLVVNQQYIDLDDEDKANTIEDFTKQAKVNARAEMVIRLTQDLEGEELMAKLSELKKSGLMIKDVFNKYQELK